MEVDGRDGLPGGVAPGRKPQFRFVKRLDPQAQAVDTQVAQEGQLGGVEVVGVGFEGDFTVDGKCEMLPQVFHKGCKLSGLRSKDGVPPPR